MPRPFVRIFQLFALAMFATALFATSSFAEKLSVASMKQLCSTSGGTLFVERTGKYSCVYSTVDYGGGVRTTSYINCQANGECEGITYCGSRICGRAPFTDRSKQTKSGGKPPPKPSKLEGPTTVTAGTAADRGFGPVGGSATGANTPAFGGVAAPSKSAPFDSGAPTLNTPAASGKLGVAKLDRMPPQLAERLRRLQSPQR